MRAVIYHGSPITPRAALLSVMPGRAACVSFKSPQDVAALAPIVSGLMLDNGAFSFWMAARKKGKETDEAERDWRSYYAWAERWLQSPRSWAVVPDAIAMPSQVNDGLLNDWPLGKSQAAPVWHMDGPLSRLLRLCEQGWERVCLGWVHPDKNQNVVGSDAYRCRMDEVARELGNRWPRLHMMRGVAVAQDYPFRFRRQHQPSAKWVAV